MDNYITGLKKAMEERQKYMELADEAEKKMLENPLDAAAEHDFDVYYKKEFDAMEQAIRFVVILTGVNDKTARKMICESDERIMKLLAKVEQ